MSFAASFFKIQNSAFRIHHRKYGQNVAQIIQHKFGNNSENSNSRTFGRETMFFDLTKSAKFSILIRG